jgi:CubicO group peptidase (beta-lactamase class C family)
MLTKKKPIFMKNYKNKMNYFLTTCTALLLSSMTVTGQINKKELKKIDEIVKKAFSLFQPAGLAVAVVSDTGIIYRQALGYANTATGKQINTHSLFNIASCTKAFTAVAMGILVDEGKVDWNDKVTLYFPEFRLADDYITRELTIEDLLCHRSGLGTFFGDLLWYGTNYTDEEVMMRIRNEPVTRRFGIDYGYQNIMFLVAGEIIEKASGMTWSQFVSSRIFEPTGMNESRPSNDELTEKQDIAYGHLNNKPLGIYDFNAAKAAAGIYSSVDELSIWTMLINNKGVLKGRRIISEKTLARIFEPHTIIGASEFYKKHGINFNMYGMGWYIYDYNGEKIAEHDGGMPGYISKVTIIPSEKLSLIILNNGNDFFINNAIKGDILDILVKGKDFDWISEYSGIRTRYETSKQMADQKRKALRISGTKPSLSTQGYTGIYNDKSYGNAEVSSKDGKLVLTFLPAEKIFTGDLEHWHYNTYKVVFNDEYLTFGLVTFSINVAGKADGFKIDLPSEDFHFWNLDFKKTK